MGLSATLACEPCTPRLVFGSVESVGAWAYLEYDGVATGIEEQVELRADVALTFGGRHVLILCLTDDMKPSAAKLSFWGECVVVGLCRQWRADARYKCDDEDKSESSKDSSR